MACFIKLLLTGIPSLHISVLSFSHFNDCHEILFIIFFLDVKHFFTFNQYASNKLTTNNILFFKVVFNSDSIS